MPTNSNEFANVVLRYEDGTTVKGIAELNDITSYLEEHKEEFARVRHGRWITLDDEYIDECKCSSCGVLEYFNKGWKRFNYCPNCGSRMDLDGEQNG